MALRKLSPSEYDKIRLEKGVSNANFDQYFVRQGKDIYLKEPDREPLVSDELTKIQGQIASKEGELSKFADTSGYLGLLKNVFDASYLSNQDIIQQRQVLRESLYGERGFKPPTMDILAPGQQEAIRTANRPGLVAGIQALNETEAARGQKVENVLGQVRQEAADRRTFVQGQLDRLYQQEADIKNLQNQQAQDNRAFGLEALTKYPSLAKMLTEQDMNDINKGKLSDSVLAKIGQASAQEESISNISQTEFTDSSGNSFLLGINKVTGEIVYRTSLGKVRLPGSGGGGGGTASERAEAADRDYYRQYANLADDAALEVFMRSYDSEFRDWFVTNIGQPYWQAGSSPEGKYTVQDLANEYKRYVKKQQPPEELTEGDINAYIGEALKSGVDPDEIALKVREAGFDPKDFNIPGYYTY